MTEFMEMGPDGLKVRHIRTLNQSSMLKCPHFIMMPEHYRADESCRCNDPDHADMAEWGYTWNGSQWT